MRARLLIRAMIMLIGIAALTQLVPAGAGAQEGVGSQPVEQEFGILVSKFDCDDFPGWGPVCTLSVLNETSNGISGYVQGYGYRPGWSVWAQALIERSGSVFWGDMKLCANDADGRCQYSFSFPDCGNGWYRLDGWSWRAGYNVQPWAAVTVTVD